MFCNCKTLQKNPHYSQPSVCRSNSINIITAFEWLNGPKMLYWLWAMSTGDWSLFLLNSNSIKQHRRKPCFVMEDMQSHMRRPVDSHLVLSFAPRQITMWASTWGSFSSRLFFCCLRQAEEDLRNLNVIEHAWSNVKVSLSVLYPSAPLPPPPVAKNTVYLCQDFGPVVKE